jgi:hypothetical protein
MTIQEETDRLLKEYDIIQIVDSLASSVSSNVSSRDEEMTELEYGIIHLADKLIWE